MCWGGSGAAGNKGDFLANDDFDSLLNDAGAPEPDRGPSATERKSSRVIPWVVVGAVLLLLAGGGVAFALLGQGGSDDSAAGSSVSPSPSSQGAPSAEPTPEPAGPESAALPAACRDIFSSEQYSSLAATGAKLSEANTGPRNRPLSEPEVPAVVESTIAGSPHLECSWTFESNFNVGIFTVLAEVSDEEAATVAGALDAAGFTALSELGSVRYITSSSSEEFGDHGYSIIHRDGVLIATEWIDWPAAGYTADIVNTVLGPAE